MRKVGLQKLHELIHRHTCLIKDNAEDFLIAIVIRQGQTQVEAAGLICTALNRRELCTGSTQLVA